MKKTFTALLLSLGIVIATGAQAFAAEPISLSKSSMTLIVDATDTFSITATNASCFLKVTSSAPSVATVSAISNTEENVLDSGEGSSKTGTVTVSAKGVGTATITVYNVDCATYAMQDISGATHTIAVTVTAKPTPTPEPEPQPQSDPTPAPQPTPEPNNTPPTSPTPNSVATTEEPSSQDSEQNQAPEQNQPTAENNTYPNSQNYEPKEIAKLPDVAIGSSVTSTVCIIAGIIISLSLGAIIWILLKNRKKI